MWPRRRRAGQKPRSRQKGIFLTNVSGEAGTPRTPLAGAGFLRPSAPVTEDPRGLSGRGPPHPARRLGGAETHGHIAGSWWKLHRSDCCILEEENLTQGSPSSGAGNTFLHLPKYILAQLPEHRPCTRCSQVALDPGGGVPGRTRLSHKESDAWSEGCWEGPLQNRTEFLCRRFRVSH